MLDSWLDVDRSQRSRLSLRLVTAAGFLLLALLLAAGARADTVLGPDDFESGFGSWTNAGGDDFDWTRLSGGTSSGSTGPSGDHTSGSGFYLYTEASSPRGPGDTAILEGPCIDLSAATDANLNFWYHMLGAGMGTLDVEVASSAGASCASLGGFANVFSQSGNLGDVWSQADVVLDGSVGGSIVIRFVGVVGSSITSDMAIDDVLVTATLPLVCNVDPDCDDSNPCTDDVCNAGTCEYTNNSDPCDDGDSCTTGDFCGAGTCQAGTRTCGPIADYVIVLTVDGVNSDMLKSGVDADDGISDEIEVKDVDDSGDYHNWKRLVDEGVYTWTARSDYDATLTTPNHVSIATGYPVGGNPGSADCDIVAGGGDTDDHCYTNNGEAQANWTVHDEGNPAISYFPSMYDVAHDRGLSTSYYASKTKFVIFDQSYDSANGAPDTTGPDDGNDKIDRYYEANVNRHFNSSVDDALEMHLQFMWEMFGIDNFSMHSDTDVSLSGTPTQRFNLTTLHYVDPDKSGHLTGWPSALYFETLRQTDDYIGDILNAIEADPILNGRTTVIVVTDHGGGNPFTHHNVVTDPVNYRIPMFVWGAGAQANAEFYALNTPTRTDPGTGRPNFDLADPSGQPVRSSDSANLALSLMGLPPIAGSIVNSLQDLAIGSAACGDGVIDAGEDCDNGASNGTPGQCCSATCSFEPAATECRASADVCDVAEQCTGTGAACPADGFEPATTECRASADVCDLAEQCTGTAAACPADGFESAGALCRGSVGACDAIELCTGTSPACPADGFVIAGIECRASADVCDVAEQCTGTAAACPADGFESAGTECRAAADVCDLAEQCTGTAATCPTDGFAPGTTPCDDGVACTESETCDGAGACDPGTPNDGLCDDTFFCNGAETCDPLLDCQSGTPPPGDGVGCTDDVCDEVLDIVVSTPNDASCDNGQFCDGDETCHPLLDCLPGQPPNLTSDGVDCTDAVCDEQDDRIEQVPVDGHCLNANLCDGSEWCNPIFGCQPPLAALDCDDGDACTADSCDALTGCANVPLLNCIVVPAASPGGRALLSLLVVGAGALLLSRPRRRTS